jgi:hypothetical protein
MKGDTDRDGSDRWFRSQGQSRAGMAATDIQSTMASRPILAAES